MITLKIVSYIIPNSLPYTIHFTRKYFQDHKLPYIYIGKISKIRILYEKKRAEMYTRETEVKIFT